MTRILGHLDSSLSGQLNAFEVLWKPVVALNTNPSLPGTATAPFALDEQYYVLTESRGANETADAHLFENALHECFDQGWANNGVIAQSVQEQKNLWAIRENIDLMLNHKPNYVFDISLPIHSMDEFIQSLHNRLENEWQGTKLFSYGHVADGNLHLIIAPPVANSKEKQQDSINRMVYEPLQQIGGSISAEHGIGFSKKPWLHYSRNDTEIQLMQSLKHLFDEHNLLNPGRIVDPC